MTVKGVRDGSAVTLSFCGCDTIDAANSADVKREALLLVGEAQNVVLDLTGIEFLDSSGVGVLVGLFKQARTRGGRARLCGLTPGVRYTLELIQLDRIFEISEGVEAPSRS